MEYNTSRKKMVLPEYGRNIQKMVDYIVTVEDKEKRNKLAQSIIDIMGNMNPHLRDIADFKHKLWDHLAIISDFQLDIDAPYDPPEIETLRAKPEPVPYKSYDTKYKHYGAIIEQLIQHALEMEEGEEKEILTQLIANHMKKSYLTWNKDSVSDELIFKDLKELSGGKLTLSTENTTLTDTKNILAKNKRKRQPRKKN